MTALPIDKLAVSRAVRVLREGGIVAFATETVYGLGADARRDDAVAKIFDAKGRPSSNPLIVHVATADFARIYASDWPDSASKLAAAFWPGPMTLVLPKASTISPLVTAGGTTVGLRVPDHDIALAMLLEFAGPVAAPSANRSNKISPTTAEHVRKELGDQVDLILDGGACDVGLESTVIDLSVRPPVLLRPGAVTREEIEQVIGKIDESSGSPAGLLRSPGMLARHYCPDAQVKLYSADSVPEVVDWLKKNRGKNVRVLAHTHIALLKGEIAVILMPTNPEDYAKNLYATLHDLDQQGIDTVWIERPPDSGKWSAVLDRLVRASS